MNKINKLISLFITLFIVFTNIIFSNASDEGYYIKNMDVKVEVNDKREYKITETLDVYFNSRSHGIIRKIPTSSTLEKYKVKDINVIGAPHEISNTKDCDIRIGDSSISVIGDKQYIVEYTLAHYKDSERDGDYVYLNVLGTEWDTYIENFTSSVTYPNNFEKLDLTVTSGVYGSTNNYLVDYEVQDNNIFIKSKNTIYPANGVTVNIKFTEGTFAKAPLNIRSIIVNTLYISSILLLIYTIVNVIISRSNRKHSMSVIEFYPPENLNSVEMGYIYSNCIYDTGILSLIYTWANNGYIKIRLLNDKDFELTKLKNADNSMTNYEKNLFDKIFYYGKSSTNTVTSSDLKYKLHSVIKECKKEIKNKFKKDDKYLKQNKKYKLISRIAFVLAISSIFLDYNGDIMNYIYTRVMIIFVILSIGDKINSAQSDESKSIIANFMNNNTLLPPLIFVSEIMILAIYANYIVDFTQYNIRSAILILVCAIVTTLFAKLIILEKNDYEKQIYSKIEGFKEFIKVAEKDRLEMLLEEDPDYFYKILPYAQVLGVTEEWLDKFESIAIPQSDYYDYGNRKYRGFYTMNHAFNKASKDMAKNPKSSSSSRGFSSGGFSGGGSGGGGGSRW